MNSKSYLWLLFLVFVGCSGVGSGNPSRVPFENTLVENLIIKYSKPDAIPIDKSAMSEEERNQILEDLIYLTDVNYYKFQSELYQGRAVFDTTTDLAILGLGAAGALVTHAATQGILAAVSGGIAGTRVSINKNIFHDQSTQALIAKMQSARQKKLSLMRGAMSLSVKDYPLSHGLSDLTEYYNAGTIVGALQNIVADAGVEKNTADVELKNMITGKYATEARPLRDRINRWLDADLKENVPLLKEWLRKQKPPITLSPSSWVDFNTTSTEMLNKAITELKIPE